MLQAVMAGIFERQAELAAAEVQDGGGTIRKANTADIPATAQTFMHYAELLAQLAEEEEHAEFVPVPSRNIIRKEPVGVCACIVPFNFPIAAASWKLAPALAAGNTVVLKPSPHTPVTALMLAEICTRAGVPAGVVNVVTGPAPEIGEALVGPSRRRQGRVHRLDQRRPARDGDGGARAQARHARARRQVAEHHPRRRQPRRRRPRRALRHVLPSGPGLRVGHARPGARVALRRLRREDDRGTRACS